MDRVVIVCICCTRPFVIHRKCYRGHRYCGDLCRSTQRCLRVRKYRRHHRASLEGRLDHRDAERARRKRLRRNVGDHTSKKLTRSASFEGDEENIPSPGHNTRPNPATHQSTTRRGPHTLVPYGFIGNRHPLTGAAARLWQALTLERLADRACIACGERTGNLDGVLGTYHRPRPRAPP
jgi:hypothetical protein